MKIGIIGAGVVGCATAWHLASRGIDVVVYEADEIAAGASGGLIAPAVAEDLAGWIATGLRPPEFRSFSLDRFGKRDIS